MIHLPELLIRNLGDSTIQSSGNMSDSDTLGKMTVKIVPIK